MNKTFKFKKGLILAEIEVELREGKNGFVFSASGSLWQGEYKIDNNLLCGGQCLDDIREYFPKNKKIIEIVDLWEKYHLNDMHAGSPKQEKFLKDNNINGWANDYTKVCEILKDNNLYEDNGYKFGCGWLFEEIPPKDLKRIKRLLKGEKEE